MKKTLIGIITFTLMSVLAPTASAAQCADIANIHGLSHTQRQEIVVACETAKLDVTTSTTKVDLMAVSEWGQVAKDWAEAIGIAAKELGFAANEFLATDAGKLTAGLIAWHILGEDIIDIVTSLLVAIVAPLIYLLMVRRSNPFIYEHKPVTYFWGLITTTERIKTSDVISKADLEWYRIVVSLGGAALVVIELIAIASIG